MLRCCPATLIDRLVRSASTRDPGCDESLVSDSFGTGYRMYYVIIASLMVICPLASVLIEHASDKTDLALLVAKWFVFWAVGVRLLLAGVRQVSKPRYTAEKILGLKGEDVLFVVRELGFANISFGVVGLLTLVEQEWTGAVALAGGLFYGQAGINHAIQRRRNMLANVAMITDLAASVILLGSLWSIIASGE